MMDSQFSEFTPDITPIMLAAHTNNYEIIKLLVQRKVMTRCTSKTFNLDSLINSVMMIHLFICYLFCAGHHPQTSPDPM